MNTVRYLAVCLIFPTLTLGAGFQAAYAQVDPFESLGAEVEDEDVKAQERDEAKTFTGSIERLLKMSGGNAESDHWQDFENVSGTPLEEKYHSSYEWRMQKELAKPLPERKPFNNSLEELEDHLGDLRPTQQGQQKQHLQDHY